MCATASAVLYGLLGVPTTSWSQRALQHRRRLYWWTATFAAGRVEEHLCGYFFDEKIVGTIKVDQIHGFTLRWRWRETTEKKKQREVLSLSDGVCTVSLDEEITLKDGRAGKVLKLVWPYTEGRSTDIIHVHLGRSYGFYWVKHEELDS